MGLYQNHVLPFLIHQAMRQSKLAAYRARVIPAAQGHVLEIGIGSGLNLPYYGAAVDHIIGLDPSSALLAKAALGARQAAASVDLIEGRAEAIPLDSQSIDTVVTTWTMCSIPDVRRALGEIRRVLKPGGSLLFVEHGRAPEPSVRRWQDRLTPIWQRIGGGCHLNRPISDLVGEAGFCVNRLQTGYMSRPKAMTFMYEGAANPA